MGRTPPWGGSGTGSRSPRALRDRTSAAAFFLAIAVIGGAAGVWLYPKMEPSLVGQERDAGRDPPATQQDGDAPQQPYG
jgi:hypothetical protein